MEDTVMPLVNVLRKSPKNECLVFQFKNSQILDSNNVPKRAGDCTPLEQFQALKCGRMEVATFEREYKQRMDEVLFNYDLDVVEGMDEPEVSQKKATEINVIEIAHKKKLEENRIKWNEETYTLIATLLTSKAVIKYKVV
jgi:hypothetical protein